MRSRRRLFAGLGIVAAFALVLAPAPAFAVQPPPPPVIPVGDIPSRVTGVAGPGTINPVEYFKYLVWQELQPGTDLAVIPKTGTSVVHVPKPITTAAPLVRGVAAAGNPAGVAITGFGVGWALGQGGLVLYAATTGQDYTKLICDTPTWYQGVNAFMMMGASPSCNGQVLVANEDAGTGLGPATFGGASIGFLGTSTRNGVNLHCYQASGSLPSGYAYVRILSPTQFSAIAVTQQTGSDAQNCRGAFPAVTHHGSASNGYPTAVSIRRTSDGAVMSTMQQLSSDPSRTPSCTIKWRDGSTTSGVGTPYKESAGVPMSAGGLGCEQAFVSKPGAGPDLMPERISVGTTGGDGNPVTVLDSEVPDVSDPATQTALDPKRGDGTGLILQRINGSNWLSCMTWEANCAGWWTTTSQGTNPGEYRCLFGGHPVALSECGVYRETFNDPSRVVISDPMGGPGSQPQPWNPGQPINTINPGTGPGTGPGDQCMAEWSMAPNPIEWILHPVKCALVWAFVPRLQVVSATQAQMTTAWEDTGIGSMTNAVTSWSFVPPGAGCGGVNVPLGSVYGHGVQNFNVLNACPGEPLAPIASLSSVVIGIASVLGLIFAVSRQFGGIVGFGGIGGGRGGE